MIGGRQEGRKVVREDGRIREGWMDVELNCVTFESMGCRGGEWFVGGGGETGSLPKISLTHSA